MFAMVILLRRPPTDSAIWSYTWWVDLGVPFVVGIVGACAAIAAAVAAFSAAKAASSANELSRAQHEQGVAREDLLARRRFGAALFRETSDALSRAAFGLDDDEDLKAARKHRIALEGALAPGIADALQVDSRATIAKWRKAPKPFVPDVTNMAEMLADLEELKVWISLWQDDPIEYKSVTATREALNRAVARLAEE